MKPQEFEPCNECRFWNDKTGCTKGSYDSPSMVIFAYCGYREPKKNEQV